MSYPSLACSSQEEKNKNILQREGPTYTSLPTLFTQITRSTLCDISHVGSHLISITFVLIQNFCAV